MRVTADACYPQTRFLRQDEELFPASYCSGLHDDYSGRVVELTVGGRQYGRCLAVFWSWEDGTPAESFYTPDGRQVLHRRFVGPEASASRNYDYDKLAGETRKLFRDKEYRLWYDTLLMES